MTRDEARAKVMAIIKPWTKNPAALETASDATSILADLKVNSARLVDIILGLEDEFGIEIDDDSADKVETIGDAVDLVERLAAS